MKKLFLTAAMALAISGAAMAAPCEGKTCQQQGEEICGECAQPGECGKADCGASEAVIAVVDITEVEAPAEGTEVQESAIAKKMTQAEKAQNAAVNDSWGGAITILAMSIVILALAVLSILFLIFGKVFQRLLARNKRESNAVAAGNVAEGEHDVDSGEVIAAIAAALSEHFAGGHDMEETILTIRKLKKAYSPWSSKIYNLRVIPEHRRNIPGNSL